MPATGRTAKTSLADNQNLTIFASRFFRKVQTIATKYDRYSTEQLEVILPHLTDPEERRLVKEELGRRYYEHYRGLGGEDRRGLEPAVVGVLDEAGAAGAQVPAETDTRSEPDGNLAVDLEELEEVAPIAPAGETPPGPGAGLAAAERPSSKGTDKWCFIATAAYGTPMAPQVRLLREFRDRRLCGRWWGEHCLRLYYRLSPPLAAMIHRDAGRRRLVRLLLGPLIVLLQNRHTDAA